MSPESAADAPDVDPDLQTLLDELLPEAMDLLAAERAFYPFGGYVGADGRFAFVPPSVRADEPTPERLLEELYSVLRDGAETDAYRAVGVATDVRVSPPGTEAATDAVRLELEHRQGVCLNVYFPYTLGADGVPEPGTPFGGQVEPHILTG